MSSFNSYSIFVNSILWNSATDEIYYDYNYPLSIIDITYSNIQGGWEGEGNIDAIPEFAAPDRGDFHLERTSPCLDAGTNNPPGGLINTDFEGNYRPLDGDLEGQPIVDMGAYEGWPTEPNMALSSTNFYFTAYQDGPEPKDQILTINNTGWKPLHLEYSFDGGVIIIVS